MDTKTKLDDLLRTARQRQMSPEEAEAQRVNFAFGNASAGDKNSTIETVRAASTIMKQSTTHNELNK